MILEKEHDQFNDKLTTRKKAEEKLGGIKEIYNKNHEALTNQQKKGIHYQQLLTGRFHETYTSITQLNTSSFILLFTKIKIICIVF